MLNEIPGQPDFRSLDRRRLIGLGGGLALTASVGGCGFLSTDPATEGEAPGREGEADTGVKEAPSLRTRVDAGELPVLEERLPNEPLVVDVPAPGVCGGTWKSVTLGPGDEMAFARIAEYQAPLRKDPMLEEIQPSLCTAIDASEDATEFTFHLREGLRWSDGEPFTADDILFAMEYWSNTEIHGAPPSDLSSHGEMAKSEKVDDYTVRITFAGPKGLFREMSARLLDLVSFPKHYLSQFVPKYNDQAKKLAEDADYESWIDHLHAKNSVWENPDRPSLFAWLVVTPLGEGNRVVMERNPYFWKTDPDGRQLPYIDTMSWEVVADPEVMVLKATDGQLDLVYRHVNSPANKPVFAKSRQEGNYELVDLKPTVMNSMCIALNLVNKDKNKRALYQDKNFRIGLSHAIDREEIITAVYQRQGEPWQAAPTKDSIYYDEEMAKQYTEFDPDLANEYLDKAGVTERDGNGFRVMPNGNQLTISVDIAAALFPEWPSAADMIKKMWQEVGIRMRPNVIDRTLFHERVGFEANEHDAAVWSGAGGYADVIYQPRWYMPWNDSSLWATPWAAWFNSRQASGVKPIAPVREQLDLYWQMEETVDPAEQEELFGKIMGIAKEQFWAIGIASSVLPYYVKSNRLQASVEGIPDTSTYRTPGHGNPEAWFLSGKS